MKDLKGEFPILSKHPGLVYLDSACTSLKPRKVIDAESSYYNELGACAGRSSHRLGREASNAVESARERVAAFVSAKADELVWTRNTTEALNIVAYGLDYTKRKKVVTSGLEHHAVLLPWMDLHERGIARLELVKSDASGHADEDAWADAIDRETALVVTNSGNNTSGVSQCTKNLARIAHDNGALVCIDGAQGVPHRKADFRRENFDFLCFSAHKMLGPTGIGALVMKKERMAGLQPLIRGGGTVKTVSLEKVVPVRDYTRFEAGVQHYSGMIGFAAACDYLKSYGMENVEAHEKALAVEMLRELEAAGATVYGPKDVPRSALYSFNIKGAKAHDVALMLDKEDIAVRSGFFCAQPAMEAMGAKEGAVRASCYIYNTSEDVKRLGDALKKISALY
ncbi:cysteine desulfurase [Candidatus Micrarchaeota archaeon]|nr:cysteine desulfurase [Candidatus Micrarchaeota archaeon]